MVLPAATFMPGAILRDYSRIALNPIGGFAPLYIAEEIANNQFKIAGGKSGMKISWQVTGLESALLRASTTEQRSYCKSAYSAMA